MSSLKLEVFKDSWCESQWKTNKHRLLQLHARTDDIISTVVEMFATHGNQQNYLKPSGKLKSIFGIMNFCKFELTLLTRNTQTAGRIPKRPVEGPPDSSIKVDRIFAMRQCGNLFQVTKKSYTTLHRPDKRFAMHI